MKILKIGCLFSCRFCCSNNYNSLCASISLLAFLFAFLELLSPSAYGQQIFDPLQRPSGSIVINSNDEYTTSNMVYLNVSCESCASVEIAFNNSDENRDTRVVDSISNIIITTESDNNNNSDTLQVEARETGPNTGVFAFEFRRSSDDVGYTLDFNDRDPILITGIPFSSSDGVKVAYATFSDGQIRVEYDDEIILDTTAPVVTTTHNPAAGALINDNTPVFDWEDPEEANGIFSYRLQISTSETFSSNSDALRFDIASLNSSSYALETELPDGRYYWRVQATDVPGNVGPFSTAFSFDIDTVAPSAPVITYPSSGISHNLSRIDISGTSEPNSTITVYLDNVMQAGSASTVADGSWSFEIDGLEDGSSHQVYAFATDRAGNDSPLSEVRRFTVSTAPTGDEFAVNAVDELRFFESVETTIITDGPFTGSSITIDYADTTEPRAATDLVTVGGKVSSSDPNPTILVDWNDGSEPTMAAVSGDGNSWSATHTYASEGTKEVVAKLIVNGGEISSNEFNVHVQNPSWISNEIIALAFAAGIAAPVLVVEYKYKLIRKSITEKTNKPPSRFYFKAGIENEKTIKDATAKFAKLVEEANNSVEVPHIISRKMVDTLSKSAGQLKETLFTIKDAGEVKTMMTALPNKGRADPDKILTEMANKGFKKMLDSLAPVYGAFFIKEITVNSQVEILTRINEGESRITSDIDIEMKPLYPFIEAGIMVGGLPTKALSVVFCLDTSVNVSQLELKKTAENKVEINLKDIIVNLQLSLYKVSPYGIELPFGIGSNGKQILNKPVDLVKREFRLDSITTTLDKQGE